MLCFYLIPVRQHGRNISIIRLYLLQNKGHIMGNVAVSDQCNKLASDLQYCFSRIKGGQSARSSDFSDSPADGAAAEHGKAQTREAPVAPAAVPAAAKEAAAAKEVAAAKETGASGELGPMRQWAMQQLVPSSTGIPSNNSQTQHVSKLCLASGLTHCALATFMWVQEPYSNVGDEDQYIHMFCVRCLFCSYVLITKGYYTELSHPAIRSKS